MDVTVQDFGQVEVLAVSGRVDSVAAPAFEKALQEASQRGKYNLVIDMSRLEYMSSAGFRALAAAQRSSRRHSQGDLVLAKVPGLVHEALDLVGFAEHFKIFGDVPSALAHFGTGMPGAETNPRPSGM